MSAVFSLGTSAEAPFRFGRIVCAVNTSRCAQDAAHQAALPTGPGDALSFLAVTDVRGAGVAAQATLSEAHAVAAVEAARELARADGVEATTSVVRDPSVVHAILQAAEAAGLLVLGARSHSRASGILLGSTSSRAVHTAGVPVLIARAHPQIAFPGVVLVASQGPADAHAATVGATIAARAATRVVLAHVGQSDADVRHALAEQTTLVREITGKDPVVVSVSGAPADRLPAMASSIGAGLIVLGSHGKRGARALASVSERVAHRADCSVLVLRPSAPSA